MFNISYTGIGIYVQHPLIVGEEVILMITFMEGVEFPAFETEYGTVKWCKNVGDWFAVGMKFNQLDANEHSI